ncbi:bifunctional transcriptional activator/DNA repair enzyme AdaA [Piscibacillus halophilus]|uniref:AraC family transcriptional regulator, regulatory protein of adaptative response / methylphosphotriester-DNA alkyltransferase methyltransferase n=1 Tax=Piscibacillus halophilus TaxID=571933 RepID=A0A1H9JTS9_9BACI|nr:Ada metal-binding domain-containing protein [Piscibacillus halophilus]SEQ90316.1 AraC family transcriptional regulator, regulatory protein of adaptative response / methylphosphotriester-DNA alkyltransferase methyltransferase [Piscibacillus halophilus]
MRDQHSLSQNVMWKAAISCNSAYDGLFFYAVKTTGIFCRPSCKSRIPKRENVSFYSGASEAQKAGYRPCKRCRPDLKSIITYDPFESVIEDTMQIIENNYGQKISLDELASMVGVSPYHLNRIFKNKTGNTPRMYLEMVRVKRAKKLLLTTTLNCTEVGYRVGYQSISSFYHAFKRNTGLSPRLFQAQNVKNSAY